MANQFFVYGTLRQGEVRWHVIEHLVTASESAALPGAQLYTVGSWPFIVLNEDDTENKVVGEVITVDDKDLQQLLMTLDGIEGYYPSSPDGSLFIRKELDVITDTGETVRAWVYVGGTELRLAARGRRYRQIDSGDWKDR